ncbi:Uncharacterized conserved protein, DUF983 family [Faunimonas pinastri]|uniref:Uncharacterized conserved protein, DUF983 family n=1 Tax=Faunimonas pinastri TaxID=1855383 RepID=A0A1H9CH93_9HYPH|nr:DUF983 domain-containing protein [Faunimonas pinastri]SEQ00103.1 Uncharacterized conserved protein, DUF983 family [Faunimonas pinastri]
MSFIERVPPREQRNAWEATLKGARGRCPRCGKGALFNGYLKVADTCPVCGEELFHHRADDAPPYLTITIVGHILVALVLWVEVEYSPPLWLHLALWFPLTILLSLVILPIAKGAIVGLQWGFGMHGFGDETPEPTGDSELVAPAAVGPGVSAPPDGSGNKDAS